MILHTVNKSPFSDPSFSDCVKLCQSGSAILLIEDGVYAAKNGSTYSQLIKKTVAVKFYVLEADILARGIKDSICDQITIINDSEFVELCTTHNSVQSWY